MFSAATLRRRFDIKPNEQVRTTVNRIHQTLRQAWEAGDIVAFIAPDGRELCEKEFCVKGARRFRTLRCSAFLARTRRRPAMSR